MPINVIELHHHGIRIGTDDEDVRKAKNFYGDVLGLQTDDGRPEIKDIPGLWMYVGRGEQTTQLHLMGAVGRSRAARSDEQDPTRPHVALAVEDIHEARRELERQGVKHWTITNLVGENSDQVFLEDPFGNVIELHQIGTCRCNRISLKE
jgi:catechol 2,3-dioxygenase-like lactoylglutathione lyase family enzyme